MLSETHLNFLGSYYNEISEKLIEIYRQLTFLSSFENSAFYTLLIVLHHFIILHHFISKKFKLKSFDSQTNTAVQPQPFVKDT